jgi:hypothetical protein
MQFLFPVKKEALLDSFNQNQPYTCMHEGYSWHALSQGKKEASDFDSWALVDEKETALELFQNKKGLYQANLKEPLTKKKVKSVLDFDASRRVNILMNSSLIDENWSKKAVAPYIHASDRVCVLAFSFFDDTKNLADWNKQFQKGQGIWYRANTDVFFPFGIKESQIEWVNYFTDSIEQMKEKIARSDILMLPGGAPDLLMKRIKEKKLKPILNGYEGLIIGYSAGAMMQLDKYHITPDEDYPDYGWYTGMGWLSGFDVEVHYKGTPIQKRCIERAGKESGLPIYAIDEKGGLIVDTKKQIRCFGKVEIFE